MTPSPRSLEVAEKMYLHILEWHLDAQAGPEFKEYIALALDERDKKAHAEGFAEGIERAAKVAEGGLSIAGDVILCDDPRDVKWEELAQHIAKKIRRIKSGEREA